MRYCREEEENDKKDIGSKARVISIYRIFNGALWRDLFALNTSHHFAKSKSQKEGGGDILRDRSVAKDLLDRYARLNG